MNYEIYTPYAEAIILITTKWWNCTKATVMEENGVSEGNSRSSSSKCQALSGTFNNCMNQTLDL